MYKLSDSTGSASNSETSGEVRDFAETLTGKAFYKDLIRKADTVPLTRLFTHYGLRLDRYNRKICCPFRSHKNGRESTASFYYYPDTNSFRCYGCNTGNPGAHGADFMSAMEGISRAKAAQKILDLFSTDVDEDAVILDRENFSEKLEIMLEFSDAVKEFRRLHNDEKSYQFIEEMCQVYDVMNARRNLNNQALRELVGTLKFKISIYEVPNL